MKTLSKHLLVVLLLTLSLSAFSQIRTNFTNASNQSPQQKLTLIKENYIESQLNLSEEERSKFLPLYRKYNSELTDIIKLKRQNQLNNNAKDRLHKDMQYSQRILDIKKQYTDEFLKIFTADKVNRIFLSEREFINEAINQLGDHQGTAG